MNGFGGGLLKGEDFTVNKDKPTRNLDTVFTVDEDRPTFVSYVVRLSGSVANIGRIELRSDADPTPTDVIAQARIESDGAAIHTRDITLTGIIPTGHTALLATVVEAGSPTFSLVTSTEWTLGVPLVEEGAAPTIPNSHSLNLVRASSQDAHILAASLSGFPTTDFTLETWIKFTSLPTSAQIYTIASQWGGSNQDAFIWDIQHNGSILLLRAFVSEDGTASTRDAVQWNWNAPAPVIDTWYHMALSCDMSETVAAGKFKWYWDGVDQGAHDAVIDSDGATALKASIQPVSLGSRDILHFSDGKFDDFRVWPVVRTPAEIAANMSIEIADASAMAIYLKLNDDAFVDQSPNGNHFSGKNGPTFSTDVPFT